MRSFKYAVSILTAKQYHPYRVRKMPKPPRWNVQNLLVATWVMILSSVGQESNRPKPIACPVRPIVWIEQIQIISVDTTYLTYTFRSCETPVSLWWEVNLAIIGLCRRTLHIVLLFKVKDTIIGQEGCITEKKNEFLVCEEPFRSQSNRWCYKVVTCVNILCSRSKNIKPFRLNVNTSKTRNSQTYEGFSIPTTVWL